MIYLLLIHMILSYCIISMLYHTYIYIQIYIYIYLISVHDISYLYLYMISLNIHSKDGKDILCMKLGTWYGKGMNDLVIATCFARTMQDLNGKLFFSQRSEVFGLLQGAWSLWGRHGSNLAPKKITKLLRKGPILGWFDCLLNVLF